MSLGEISRETLLSALGRRFGASLKLRSHERRLYGYDAMGMAFGMPAAVVQVESLEDVVDLVEIVRRSGGAIVARGAGTGLSGGSVPSEGEVVLSYERMKGIGEVLPERYEAHAEAGVVNETLDRHLAGFGLRYPPDPASFRVSTIGGNIATNAGGPHAVKYGVTGQHVEALRVVDALGNADWVYAGALQPGPDLVALMVGSEGTLALVCEARLRVTPRPEDVATMLLSFQDIARATDYVSAVVAQGMVPATMEFLDRNCIETIEAWGATRYPEGAGAVLLVEFDGTREEVAEGVRRAQELGTHHGAFGIRVARDAEERDELWLGRRGAYAATARHGRRVFTQDITVPRDKLTEILGEVERIARREGLMVATKGHAGDGNLHPDFPYDPADAEISARVHRANHEVMQACVRLGGSITGEHGVGTEKLDGMGIMFSPQELGLMWAVRQALDPDGVLNPGKAVPAAPRVVPEEVGAAEGVEPANAEDVQAAVLRARREKRPFVASLRGLGGIRLSLANMTAEVGAGTRIEALQSALAGSALRFLPDPLRARTFGELLLSNDYGPEQVGSGTLRRHLLSLSYVTGAGEIVHMGRGVVKNVAGYDLYRLLIGSRGRFGVPIGMTLRLGPPPEGEWWKLQGPLARRVEARDAKALFGLWREGGCTLYARAQSAPADGWQRAPEAQDVLRQGKEDFTDAAGLFDAAGTPGRLEETLNALGDGPAFLLPAAGRMLARIPPALAESLAARLAAGGQPLRAEYGLEHRPLLVPPGLAGEWEARLRHVFDPDGILESWNEWGGGA